MSSTLSLIHIFRQIPGEGVAALVDDHPSLAGNLRMMEARGIETGTFAEAAGRLADEGKTPLFFAQDGELLGIVAVADTVKPSSAAALVVLKGMGIRTVMLTGDNERTAAAIQREVGADVYKRQTCRRCARTVLATCWRRASIRPRSPRGLGSPIRRTWGACTNRSTASPPAATERRRARGCGKDSEMAVQTSEAIEGAPADQRRPAVRGHALALVTVVVWAVTFVSTKVLLVHLAPIEILFFRFVIGFVALALLRPRILHVRGFKAVSYTHLDVYKRQALHPVRPAAAQQQRRYDGQEHRDAHHGRGVVAREAGDEILDVYKRQDDGHELARGHAERHVVERLERRGAASVHLGEMVDGQNVHEEPFSLTVYGLSLIHI